MTIPAYFGTTIGPDFSLAVVPNNNSSYAMAALNAGWSARFRAPSTTDIGAVRLNWATVSAPGVVTLRIETDSNGKPSGTLYDANATYSITPATGVQTYTFATPPSTGLVQGNDYHVVLLTTTGGTTQTLFSHLQKSKPAWFPISLLTAADGTTRTNFAEIANGSIPTISLVDVNSVEMIVGLCPYKSSGNYNAYGNNVMGLKVTLDVSVNISGIMVSYVGKTGTPAGGLRCRIFDSGNNVVAGTTISIALNDLTTNAGGNGCVFLFPSVVTLAAETYKIGIDSSGSANSSNCWNVKGVTAFVSAVLPAKFVATLSTDNGTNWSDQTTDLLNIQLMIDSFPVVGGGGLLVHSGMNGGMRG